ncbi:MAG: ABC transporter substrate-binding protein [Gemmatimonadaceae bacterium]|jgi:ABC-type nitrate/sulfonate/bicarbonate transport system substrate-binding protein|nr:ABC transporter substrate-binding protein [Gemmatimonadaceae bacterium]
MPRLPRRRRVAFIAGLLVALFAGPLLVIQRRGESDAVDRATAERATPAAADSTERPIRIGYLSFVATLPYFVAEEKRYFAEEGLVVAAEVAATSNQLVNALAAGQVDFVPALSAAPVLALEAASPGRVRLTSTSIVDAAHPFDALLVPDASPRRTVASLRGARIGVFPGTTASRLLMRWLATEGIDTTTITLVPLPPPQQLGALRAGRIDVLHAYEPTTTIAQLAGGVRTLVPSVYAALLSPNPQGVAALAVPFVTRDSARATRLVRAMDRAFAWVAAHPDSARQILRTRLSLDSAVAARVALPYMVPSAQIDTVALARYAALLHSVGDLPAVVPTATLVWRGRAP